MTISQDFFAMDQDNKPRYAVFSKMEAIIKEMNRDDTGIVIRTKKTGHFTGSDVVEWLRKRFQVEAKEANHLANLLCQYGYIYPVDLKTFFIKDDRNTEYRFQLPYYWPSSKARKPVDSIEYAIYLQKRNQRNKKHHELEKHEEEAYEKLMKIFCDKKEFIQKQAEAQIQDIKKKERSEKRLLDAHERAFWRIQKPPKTQVNSLEEGQKRNFSPSQIEARKKKNKESYKAEVQYLKKSIDRPRMRLSILFEWYKQRWEQYKEYDPFLDPNAACPSNPWITEDTTFWEINSAVDCIPTELQVKKWSLGFNELLSDQRGRQEFAKFLQKEYSFENLQFWLEVQQLKLSATSKVDEQIERIFTRYLDIKSQHEINIDSKTLDEVVKYKNDKTVPSGRRRYVFECAQDHIYNLMKNDSYTRFLRSEQYKNLLAMSKQQPFTKKNQLSQSRRGFFSFGGNKRQTAAPTPRPQTPSPKSRHRDRKGSNSSDQENSDMSGDSPLHAKAHHSYSTGNLKELDGQKHPSLTSCKSNPPHFKNGSTWFTDS